MVAVGSCGQFGLRTSRPYFTDVRRNSMLYLVAHTKIVTTFTRSTYSYSTCHGNEWSYAYSFQFRGNAQGHFWKAVARLIR